MWVRGWEGSRWVRKSVNWYLFSSWLIQFPTVRMIIDVCWSWHGKHGLIGCEILTYTLVDVCVLAHGVGRLTRTCVCVCCRFVCACVIVCVSKCVWGEGCMRSLVSVLYMCTVCMYVQYIGMWALAGSCAVKFHLRCSVLNKQEGVGSHSNLAKRSPEGTGTHLYELHQLNRAMLRLQAQLLI